MDPLVLPGWLLWDKYLLLFVQSNPLCVIALGIALGYLAKRTPWKWDDAVFGRISEAVVDRFKIRKKAGEL